MKLILSTIKLKRLKGIGLIWSLILVIVLSMMLTMVNNNISNLVKKEFSLVDNLNKRLAFEECLTEAMVNLKTPLTSDYDFHEVGNFFVKYQHVYEDYGIIYVIEKKIGKRLCLESYIEISEIDNIYLIINRKWYYVDD